MRKNDHRCVACGGRKGILRTFFGFFGRSPKKERLSHVPVAQIKDNPMQPRRYIMADAHEDLKMSIAQYGVIVPIIVNPNSKGYILVAGQRRLKAVRALGMETIPAIVRKLNRKQMMEMSFIENLHREDLSQVDVVKMFDRVRKNYPALSEEELAVAMGLDEEGLQHARSLLDLPVPALEAMRAGMINEDQALIIAEIDDLEVMSTVIDTIYAEKFDAEGTQEFVDRILHKPPRFISNEDSPHFHSPACPFALLIPDTKRARFYSKREAGLRGKIACMQCL